MIDLNPANVKLRDRAVRIVRALTGTDYAAAQGALERSGWVIKKAVARLAVTGGSAEMHPRVSVRSGSRSGSS
jgi:N-acetylmuramic acid 6-phosphate (MurNAc-6-P) etherase